MSTESFVFINFANSGVKDFIFARVRRATYASLGYEERVYDSKNSTTNYLTVTVIERYELQEFIAISESRRGCSLVAQVRSSYSLIDGLFSTHPLLLLCYWFSHLKNYRNEVSKQFGVFI